MKLLVTGGTGLIGGHLLRALQGRHEVFALARTLPEDPQQRPAEWIEQDLLDPLDPAKLPSAIDSVIHLAQSSRYRELPEGAEDVFEVNVASTLRLLEYARHAGAGSFVLASTGGLYARSGQPLREGDPLDPPDLYFRSKQLAELLLEQYGSTLRGVALRPFFVYGPGSRGMLVSRLAELVRADKTISIEGRQGMLINPIFVADAVQALVQAVETDCRGVFNVAGRETVSVTELVELIGEIVGSEPRIEHGDAEPGGLVADVSRMESTLGVVPEVGLREGISALLGITTETAPG